MLARVRDHQSEAVVVSLGVDCAVDDAASPLRITREGFASAGVRLGSLGLPTVFVQEGGYDLNRLSDLVLAVLQSFEWRAGR
jgi:acetoin utilization deacetylase AcuC-like enzyme